MDINLCPYCKMEISAAARKCIHCNEYITGKPEYAGKDSEGRKISLLTMILFVVSLIFFLAVLVGMIRRIG